MEKRIEAFLREEGSLRELTLTGAEKPEVDPTFVQRWQSVFNLIAMGAHEPVALFLRIARDSISVLLKSETADQKIIEYYLWHEFYCESTLGKSGLLVTNTLSRRKRQFGNVDTSAIASCFGLPVQWPDGELFGVVCVLHKPGIGLKQVYIDILTELKITFEQELILLDKQHLLLQTAETDPLTSIFNRRKIEDVLKHEYDRAKRYFLPFSITIIDLNGFKQINDTYGHDVGDEVLKAFTRSVGDKIRETDYFGRWGGDEFILVCPYTNSSETLQMLSRITPSVNEDMRAAAAFSNFSFGVAQFEQTDQDFQAIIKRADESMYQYKTAFKQSAQHVAR